jgi:2-amino-4-hydroxy-6-hydroxymethyldihydropteridine diphosphokinase
MKCAYIGIGSNLEDRLGNIHKSLQLIKNKREISLVKVSSVYETEPVDFHQQPNFLNAVAEICTELTAYELLEELHDIENRLGRVRTVQKGPRTIDLDILLYDDMVINTQGLSIPHPRMWQRLFVLEPLSELKPDLRLPTGENIQSRCNFLRKSQRVRLFMKIEHDIILS